MAQGTGHQKHTSDKGQALTVTEPSGLLEFLLARLSHKSRNNVKSLLTHKRCLWTAGS